MHAAVGKQHRPCTAADAAPSLLPPQLSPVEHMDAACKLQHPFAALPPLELDVQYAVQAYAVMGPLKREKPTDLPWGFKRGAWRARGRNAQQQKIS